MTGYSATTDLLIGNQLMASNTTINTSEPEMNKQVDCESIPIDERCRFKTFKIHENLPLIEANQVEKSANTQESVHLILGDSNTSIDENPLRDDLLQSTSSSNDALLRTVSSSNDTLSTRQTPSFIQCLVHTSHTQAIRPLLRTPPIPNHHVSSISTLAPATSLQSTAKKKQYNSDSEEETYKHQSGVESSTSVRFQGGLTSMTNTAMTNTPVVQNTAPIINTIKSSGTINDLTSSLVINNYLTSLTINQVCSCCDSRNHAYPKCVEQCQLNKDNQEMNGCIKQIYDQQLFGIMYHTSHVNKFGCVELNAKEESQELLTDSNDNYGFTNKNVKDLYAYLNKVVNNRAIYDQLAVSLKSSADIEKTINNGHYGRYITSIDFNTASVILFSAALVSTMEQERLRWESHISRKKYTEQGEIISNNAVINNVVISEAICSEGRFASICREERSLRYLHEIAYIHGEENKGYYDVLDIFTEREQLFESLLEERKQLLRHLIDDFSLDGDFWLVDDFSLAGDHWSFSDGRKYLIKKNKKWDEQELDKRLTWIEFVKQHHDIRRRMEEYRTEQRRIQEIVEQLLDSIFPSEQQYNDTGISPPSIQYQSEEQGHDIGTEQPSIRDREAYETRSLDEQDSKLQPNYSTPTAQNIISTTNPSNIFQDSTHSPTNNNTCESKVETARCFITHNHNPGLVPAATPLDQTTSTTHVPPRAAPPYVVALVAPYANHGFQIVSSSDGDALLLQSYLNMPVYL